jgi:hypothetical protein
MKTATPLRITLGALLLSVLVLILPSTAFSSGNIEDHIIETETGIYYIVQPGDTLWDLSKQFSDSPWLWPDLWNENQQITNPHLIYPGDRIKLYRRSDLSRVGESETMPKRVGKTFVYKDIDAVGFIRKAALEPSGVVIDVKRSKTLLSDYDEIYIAAEKGHSFVVGDKYTVYRTLKEIRDNETKAYIGIQHLLLAVVDITQVTPDVVVGTVDKTFRAFEIGDLVTPYLKRPAEFEIKESVPGLEGKLIATEDHHRLIAQDRTAFIDKGEMDGVEVGQFYTIYVQEKNRVASNGREKTVQLPPQKLGSVLVLHTEETTATALVVKSETGIDAWTPIRTPF